MTDYAQNTPSSLGTHLEACEFDTRPDEFDDEALAAEYARTARIHGYIDAVRDNHEVMQLIEAAQSRSVVDRLRAWLSGPSGGSNAARAHDVRQGFEEAALEVEEHIEERFVELEAEMESRTTNDEFTRGFY